MEIKLDLSKEYNNKRKYTVYTDGGCLFNPDGPGGCAAIIIDDNTGEKMELSEGYASTTNNRMEIRALILALKNIPDNSIVKIYTDSQYAMCCAIEYWERNANTDLWKYYDKVSKNKEIEFEWVRSHSGNEGNERCDELSSKAMKNENLLVDNGYFGTRKKRTLRKRTIEELAEESYAMNITVKIPKNVNQYFDTDSIIYKTKPEVVESIQYLNNKKKITYKDLFELDTVITDDISKLNVDKVIKLCGTQILQCVRDNCADEEDTMFVALWYLRGLKLEYAIRKRILMDEYGYIRMKEIN